MWIVFKVLKLELGFNFVWFSMIILILVCFIWLERVFFKLGFMIKIIGVIFFCKIFIAFLEIFLMSFCNLFILSNKFLEALFFCNLLSKNCLLLVEKVKNFKCLSLDLKVLVIILESFVFICLVKIFILFWINGVILVIVFKIVSMFLMGIFLCNKVCKIEWIALVGIFLFSFIIVG